MDKKTFTIGVLTVTAVLLFIAQFLPVQRANAAETIKDRAYMMVTGRNQQGGETLYVTENRSGLIGVFTWDTSSRTVKLRAVMPVADAFK